MSSTPILRYWPVDKDRVRGHAAVDWRLYLLLQLLLQVLLLFQHESHIVWVDVIVIRLLLQWNPRVLLFLWDDSIRC